MMKNIQHHDILEATVTEGQRLSVGGGIEPEKDSAAIISESATSQVLVIIDADFGLIKARKSVIVGDCVATDEKRFTLATVDVVRVDRACVRCDRLSSM